MGFRGPPTPWSDEPEYIVPGEGSVNSIVLDGDKTWFNIRPIVSVQIKEDRR